MIITRYSFHHFIQPEMFFKEMKRVCKKDGIIIVDVTIPLKKEMPMIILKNSENSHISTPVL